MIHKLLGGLQIFVGIGAIPGGLALVLDPTGAMNSMDTSLLEASPFDDFLVPGLLLLLINGAASILAGVRSFRRGLYFAETGVVLGVFLMSWIAMQVYWIGLSHWLQPLYFCLGALEVTLALVARRATR